MKKFICLFVLTICTGTIFANSESTDSLEKNINLSENNIDFGTCTLTLNYEDEFGCAASTVFSWESASQADCNNEAGVLVAVLVGAIIIGQNQ